MPESTQTKRVYGPADFLALGGNPINLATLTAALESLTLVEPLSLVDFVPGSTTRVLVLWDGPGVPTGPETTPGTDLALVQAVIAAHAGFATSSLLQSFSSIGETQNTTTSFIDKDGADFVSTPLDGGRWGLRIAAQLRTTTLVINSGVRAIMRAGLGPSLSGADDRAYTDHSIFSATQPQLWTYTDIFPISSGQVLRFQPRFARSGAAVTAAMLNFYADLFRIGD